MSEHRVRLFDFVEAVVQGEEVQSGDRGVKSLAAMRKLELPEPDGRLLRELLEAHDLFSRQIKEQEKQIATSNASNWMTGLLATLPGMGVILAPVAACEIDDIERFCRSEKLCAYAGLAPITRAGGGKVYQGKLLPECNKWLRWAFIEAAWVAVGCSGYFGAIYRRHRERGKKANTAICAVAHRMCQIACRMPVEQRPYSPKKPACAGAFSSVKNEEQISPAAPVID